MRRAAMRGRRRTARGVALIGVLWIIALLVVTATGIAAHTRVEQRLARNLIAGERSYQAAAGGVYYGAYLLFHRPRQAGEAWYPETVLHIGGSEVEVAVLDERSRIDLNAAPAELLDGLFRAAGIEPDARARLVDAVLDWRDADALRRLHGAEDRDYRAAGLDYEAKDAPFAAVEELQRVLGVSTELYRQVRDALTVHSGKADINPLTAGELALAAIPGMSAELAAGYRELRERRKADGLPPPPFPLGGSPYVTDARGPAYTVAARATLPAGAAAAIDAVVAETQAPGGGGFDILAWQSAPGR